jgi:hypothetical protein
VRSLSYDGGWWGNYSLVGEGNDERRNDSWIDLGSLGGKGRKTRLPRFARNDGIMMCHSECSEESTPSVSQLADPSQNRLRMTKRILHCRRGRTRLTPTFIGHCEKRRDEAICTCSRHKSDCRSKKACNDEKNIVILSVATACVLAVRSTIE